MINKHPSDLEMCVEFDPHDKLTVEIMRETIIPRLIDEMGIWERGVEQFNKAGCQEYAELCHKKAEIIRRHLEIAFERLGANKFDR